jgi:choline dehydrogenase-like flavoprotein
MVQTPQREHGYDGPITVAHISSSGRPRNYPLKSMIEDIYSQAGVPRIDDVNSGKTIGFSELACNTFNGERQYAPVCYSRGNNVTVWVGTSVARLIFEDTRAVGVELLESRNGVQKVLAKKEVIVSGGCQGSPKLLLLRYVKPKFSDLSILIHPVESAPNPNYPNTTSNKSSTSRSAKISPTIPSSQRIGS